MPSTAEAHKDKTDVVTLSIIICNDGAHVLSNAAHVIPSKLSVTPYYILHTTRCIHVLRLHRVTYELDPDGWVTPR